jgi:predicted RNA polymerase sigma factor
VEVNRAVAHGRAAGPDAGLAVLDALPGEALAGSHLRPAVRGDLLARAGRDDEAAACFRAAAGLTRNEGERRVLLGRAAELVPPISFPTARRNPPSPSDAWVTPAEPATHEEQP